MTLTTTDLGQAGAAIEAEEARKVIEGLRKLLRRAKPYVEAICDENAEGGMSADDEALLGDIDAALGGKP